MKKLILPVIFVFAFMLLKAQPVQVHADYNNAGDVHFVAYNNTKVPLFLNIRFDDLENTTFDEPLPYLKKMEPGFNSLFTLLHDPGADGYPRFHYDIKIFRSNPAVLVDLDYPYLIPFEPGTKVQSLTVETIHGFWASSGLKSWSATGFQVLSGKKVYAARTGIVVEMVAQSRETGILSAYNGWNYTITLLQPDGTLACYKNITGDSKLKLGQKVFAGQLIGLVSPGANELLFLIYHESFTSDEPLFIIPEFVISETEKKIIISEGEFSVLHPEKIRNQELSKKEIRNQRKR